MKGCDANVLLVVTTQARETSKIIMTQWIDSHALSNPKSVFPFLLALVNDVFFLSR